MDEDLQTGVLANGECINGPAALGDPYWERQAENMAQYAEQRAAAEAQQEAASQRQMRLASLEAALRLNPPPASDADDVLRDAERFATFLIGEPK